MSDIRQWLEGLDLGQYADAFEENDIDTRLLPRLTDEGLKEVGVKSLGHRLQMLEAIEALSHRDTQSETVRAATAQEPEPEKEVISDAERRQITVMFCDLVGSTALSEKLDPEDLRALMQAYQKACGEVVERYEGHVAQYLGDGLMTYFGWPRAHEDDAGRAIRASLDIIEAVKQVDTPETLHVRVGVATGPVVVGETGAGDASVPKMAVGETPNVAARVQTLADPDEILIAPATHRLAGGSFEYDDLGEHALKGIIEPLRVWRIKGLARVEDRFEAAHGLQLTPFVGRKEEVGLVLRRWEQAREGDGQVITLCAEPGIGKSRILREVQSRMASTPHMTLRYQCSPYHTNVALHPFSEQLDRSAGLGRDDEMNVKCEKLEAQVVARGLQPAAVMPLLGPLLSLDTGSRYPELNLTPQKQKDETLMTLRDLVIAAAMEQPALVIFEDVHWMDPTSREALDLIVPAVAGRPVLMVIAHRPEYTPPWTGFSHIMPLTLTRLARRQAAEMVARVTAGAPLPDEVLDEIVAKTDGVPLFVEELTKTVIESGLVERDNGAYRLTGSLSDFSIPSTLHDSLMARLDRLATMREVAQIGACIGREFSHELLATVSPMQDNALNDAVQQLVASELIYAVGAPPNATYTFKHALIQDAAYESLLRRRRCEVHLAIAETLAGMPGTESALLASHYTRAEVPDLAVPTWLAAGQKALASAQYVESIAHLKSGLALVGDLDSEQGRVDSEISLHTCLALNYVATRSYGASEVEMSYTRAEELLPNVKDDAIALPVLLGIGIFYWLRADFRLSVKYFEDLHKRAERAEDELMVYAARSQIATIQYSVGKANLGKSLIERVLDDYDLEKHAVMTSNIGQDSGVLAAGLGAQTLNFLGFFDTSRKMAEQGIAIARTIKHPFNIGMALALASVAAIERKETSTAVELARQCLDVCEEQGLAYWGTWARVARGAATAFNGDPETGAAEIAHELDDLDTLGSIQSRTHFGAYWAEAMLLGGHAEAVRETMRHHLTLIDQFGQDGLISPTRLMIGRALLALPKADKEGAEAEFLRCLDCARNQGGKRIELLAATSLAQLWISQGKNQEARDLLSPVYDWFTEGFQTADVIEAKTLLQQL